MKIEAFIIFKEATVLYMYTGTCIFREMYGQTSYMYVTVAFLTASIVTSFQFRIQMTHRPRAGHGRHVYLSTAANDQRLII